MRDNPKPKLTGNNPANRLFHRTTGRHTFSREWRRANADAAPEAQKARLPLRACTVPRRDIAAAAARTFIGSRCFQLRTEAASGEIKRRKLSVVFCAIGPGDPPGAQTCSSQIRCRAHVNNRSEHICTYTSSLAVFTIYIQSRGMQPHSHGVQPIRVFSHSGPHLEAPHAAWRIAKASLDLLPIYKKRFACSASSIFFDAAQHLQGNAL